MMKTFKFILLAYMILTPMAYAQTDTIKLIKPYQQKKAKRNFKKINILEKVNNSDVKKMTVYTPDPNTQNIYHLSIEILGRTIELKSFLGLGTLEQAEQNFTFAKIHDYNLSVTTPKQSNISQIRNAPIGSVIQISHFMNLYNPRNPSQPYFSLEIFTCNVVGNIPANTLHPTLQGDASQMNCLVGLSAKADTVYPTQYRKSSLYFLKDYQIFLPTTWEKLDVII